MLVLSNLAWQGVAQTSTRQHGKHGHVLRLPHLTD